MIIYIFFTLSLISVILYLLLKIKRDSAVIKAFNKLESGETDYVLFKNSKKKKLTRLERSYLKISDNFNAIIKSLNEFNDSFSDYLKSLSSQASIVSSNLQEQDNLILNFEATLSIQSSSIETAASGLDQTRQLFKAILGNYTSLFNKIESLLDMNRKIQEQNNNMNEDSLRAIEFTTNLKNVTDSGLSKIDNIISFIEKLDSSVKKINEMAGIISGITAKTSLLSMNASIEAAHAGEAGKGFAVVAGEIRKLSESSDKATKSINSTINEIFTQMSEGKETSNLAKDGINDISNEIDKAIQIMNALSDNIRKQITGTIDTKNIINDIHSLSKEIKESSVNQEKKVNEIYETTDIVNSQGFIINSLITTQKAKLRDFNKISNNLFDTIKKSSKYSDYYKETVDLFKIKND